MLIVTCFQTCYLNVNFTFTCQKTRKKNLCFSPNILLNVESSFLIRLASSKEKNKININFDFENFYMPNISNVFSTLKAICSLNMSHLIMRKSLKCLLEKIPQDYKSTSHVCIII